MHRTQAQVFPIQPMGIFEVNSSQSTVAAFKTSVTLGNLMAIGSEDKLLGLFQVVGDQLLQFAYFNGPTDLGKSRFQGGINLIFNKKNSNIFYMFSYAHRAYAIDYVLMTVEERNKLFNDIEAGNGFLIDRGFLIENTDFGIGFGSYNAVDRAPGADNMYSMDLTTTGAAAGMTQITSVGSNDHTHGCSIDEGAVGPYKIALGSWNYGGKIMIGDFDGGSTYSLLKELLTD